MLNVIHRKSLLVNLDSVLAAEVPALVHPEVSTAMTVDLKYVGLRMSTTVIMYEVYYV